jgi:hypothetical protein
MTITGFVLGLPFSLRQQKLSDSRSPMSKSQFIETITLGDGDGQAAEILWDSLVANNVVVDGFTPYPDDSLCFVYGVAEEELDEDLIARVFVTLKVPLPDAAFMKHFGKVDSAWQIAKLVGRARSVASGSA